MEKVRIDRVSQLEPVIELNISAREVISVYNPNREKAFSSNYLESSNKELINFLHLLLNAKGFPVSVNRGVNGFQINPCLGYVFNKVATDEKDRVAIVLSKNLGVSYAAR
jgi:hypothetical protein